MSDTDDFADLYSGADKIFYEDIVIDNKKKLGSCFVDRKEVIAFAKEWDPQPFHLDEEAAKNSIYGCLTGSSIHMLAVLSKQVSSKTGNLAALANLSTRFDMPNPMRVGDTLTFYSQATEKRLSKSRPGVGIVSFQAEAKNQHDAIVMNHFSTVMIACQDYLAN